VFIARDENNKDTSATTVVDDLKTKGVYEKLEKNGMVVTDIKRKIYIVLKMRQHAVVWKNNVLCFVQSLRGNARNHVSWFVPPSSSVGPFLRFAKTFLILVILFNSTIHSSDRGTRYFSFY
jgi:hypothetical protein